MVYFVLSLLLPHRIRSSCLGLRDLQKVMCASSDSLGNSKMLKKLNLKHELS